MITIPTHSCVPCLHCDFIKLVTAHFLKLFLHQLHCILCLHVFNVTTYKLVTAHFLKLSLHLLHCILCLHGAFTQACFIPSNSIVHPLVTSLLPDSPLFIGLQRGDSGTMVPSIHQNRKSILRWTSNQYLSIQI